MMINLQRNTFYDAIKPLVYTNWFIGMGVFRLPNQSSTTRYLVKFYTVIFIFSNWMMIYVTSYSLHWFLVMDTTSPIGITMYEALFNVNSLMVVISPLLVWFRRKAIRFMIDNILCSRMKPMQDCVQRMVILDDTFQNVFGAQNEYKRQYIRLICQMVVIFSAVFMVATYDSLLALGALLQMSRLKIIIYVCIMYTLHHPITVTLVLDVNFCHLVGYLGKKFRNINNRLLEFPKKPLSCHDNKLFRISRKIKRPTSNNIIENPGIDLLREIREAHLELCKLTRTINLAFGIQNLLSMGISFVMITGLSYTIYSALASANFTYSSLKSVAPSIIWSMIYAFKIWMINHSCSVASSEAEKTGQVIYEVTKCTADKELQREIHEFGIQMLQNPVRFNACGFFTLDHTFLQSVIGSITTYLVIIIQMSQVSSCNTVVTSNSTGVSAD